MEFNPTIFREYDLRGLAATDLKPGFARGLGRAFAGYLEAGAVPKRVVVGHDNRLTSPGLTAELVEGLMAAGTEVIGLGQVPTPVFYFANQAQKTAAGIMVTASHNPPAYNGFKLVVNQHSLYGPQIQEIGRILAMDRFPSGRGSFRQETVLENYLAALRERTALKRPVRVVLDCGNGTAGPVALPALQSLGAEVIPLYCDSDPTFPHHLPDPLVPANLKDLAARVRETGAEAGIGIDGDGDRIGVCDERGEMMWGDKILGLLIETALRARPGAPIVYDVKCTLALEEEIRRLGGRPLMWKTGHSLIEQKMHEVGSPAAGELSGHLYFADRWFGFDDAIYASARFLAYLSESQTPLSRLAEPLNTYLATPEIRLEVPEERKFDLVRDLERELAAEFQVSTIDGVRVVFPDGWGLVRASNTQPALVLRFEARTAGRRDEIERLITGRLRRLLA
ncbi:MAG TPA: phosphomannomutase/phosphoglucomutase [bacterium]|uniref:Phosphomannomutase/phosphoglucomutase n=1 Tax=candidate division TA06 bacterium ADurb.Bin417 TaxID=1852828 RepID=A0A1V5MJK4_UNCT6|nr:MAG: Phosphomannomutase/phosphoglucomutase [candidate division TA06 bacterium ADurb.Bin417]HNQ34545.1 phosphomannomutase/phosphoglucomutase [bacterium]HNS49024.1 phosphomannomutase/phosphoglucomutase [bacterium]